MWDSYKNGKWQNLSSIMKKAVWFKEKTNKSGFWHNRNLVFPVNQVSFKRFTIILLVN